MTTNWRRCLSLIAIGALASGACADDDTEVDTGPCFVPGATACDVLTAECMEAVWESLGCLLEQDLGPPPNVTILSPEEYSEFLDEGHTPRDDLERAAAWDVAMQRSLVMPQGTRLAEESGDSAEANVRAFYLYADETVYLIDSGWADDREFRTGILAHEFAHAAQDRAVDLEADRGLDSTDRRLTWQSVVEGEASLQELRFVTTQNGGIGLDSDAAERAKLDWVNRFLAVLTEAESKWVYGRQYFPYPFGCDLVRQAFREGDISGVAELLTSPPESTHQVMFGSAGVSSAFGSLFDLRPTDDEGGWEVVDVDEWGAWGLLVAAAAVEPTRAWEFAEQWRGDRFVVAVTPDDYVGAWLVEFDDSEQGHDAAAGFREAFERVSGPGERSVSGTGSQALVLFHARDDDEIARSLGVEVVSWL